MTFSNDGMIGPPKNVLNCTKVQKTKFDMRNFEMNQPEAENLYKKGQKNRQIFG